MNVYIVADVEGVAGVVFYEHRHLQMSMLNYEVLHRNRVLLTEEVNAAARGAFDAGADSVVVHDHHGFGYTILPDLIDKRLELIQIGVKKGLEKLSKIKPFIIPGPCTVRIADRNPDRPYPSKTPGDRNEK